MQDHKYEFKLKRPNSQYRDFKDIHRWEDLPVIAELTITPGAGVRAQVSPDFCNLIAGEISWRNDGAEVRWNRKGSLQGHYVKLNVDVGGEK
jgi:hypothetical protein